MLQWKQRLYAFLLRRVLGPLLDAESLTRLYQTIDISLNEGRFALNDVALNTEYFANLLKDKLSHFRIRKARIRRLEIHLTLQDHSLDEGEELSSLAWRAIKLGSISATEGGSPAVSLLALVEIDGLVIEIEPHPFVGEPSEDVDPESLPTPAAEPSSSKSILSSYVDAALSSLRLTMKLSNVQVRICSGHKPSIEQEQDSTSKETWLEFKLKSVSYHDVEVASSGDEDSEYETVMQKAVDINRVTILVGETAHQLSDDDGQVPEKATASTSTIALLEGSSRVCLRAIEYKTSTSTRWETSASDCRRLQHDVEMNLDQRLNLSVDESSLLQIQKIVQSFRDISRSSPSSSGSGEHRSSAAERLVHQDSSIDQADLSAIDAIMKQYQEARLYAERNEIRGGILIPSTAEEDGRSGDEVTFDAFFDANEKSFYRYSTVLRESVLLQVDTEKADHDFVHTKIRFHLKGGGVKVSFRAAPDGSAASTIEATPSRRPDDYMLLTFTDLNLSSSLSLRESDFEFSVANLDLEDSQIDRSSGQGPTGSSGRRAEIGSVLQFSPSRGGGNASLDDSDILLEAPCLSLHAKVENEGECRTSDVELTLESFELTYRQAAMSNTSNLLKTMQASGELHPKEAESVDKSQSPSGNNVKFFAFCDSISINIPLPLEKDWGSLYERCGYDAAGSMTTRSSLGILFDQVTLELNGEDSPEESTSLSCHHALFFASSPCGKHNLERKLQHFDIIAMSGLTDVHPVIPVSLKLYRNKKEGGDGANNHGAACFPVVPTISSFKARQEDEDEDNRIDRVLSSKLNDDLPMGVRKGLRADDPQSAMLSEASESDTVLDIRIPEIIGDLTSNELVALSEMLECLRENLVPASNTPRSDTEPPASTHRVGLSLNCDYLSLAVHGSLPQPTTDLDGCDSLPFSYMIKLDRLKTHVLLPSTGLRHVRVLAHELDFFEISNLLKPVQTLDPLCSSRTRRDALRDRSTSNPKSSVTPVFHRSHLFSPISRQSPSFLFDIINVSLGNRDKAEDLEQKNIHLTLYDMTYRYDFDSGWMNRLRSIFAGSAEVVKNDSRPAEPTSAKTLTRIFLSVADCNVDYLSAPRFNTPSRTILRVGDLRLSSNLVLPVVPVQAFSLSLGDVTVYLCPRRYPYNFENSRLLHSASLMKPEDVSLSRSGLSPRSTPTAESVLREMNYRAILMLDSMDAIFAISTSSACIATHPNLSANITVGEVSLFGCKDSFARLVKTIGELQAEMTAVSDETMTSLRTMSMKDNSATGNSMDCASVQNETNESESGYPTFFALDDLKRQSALRPSAGTSTNTDSGKQFLLDGYDWTAIDLDESNESGIPPGEEQAAGWYGKTEVAEDPNDECEEVGFLPGHGLSNIEDPKPSHGFTPSIISHHFPLQPVSDPLGDGDMGAAKYGGTELPPQVHNRVMVHDLAVKLRFFDGYDWPELLNEGMRSAVRKGAFVIDEDSARIAMKSDVLHDIKSKLNAHDVEKLQRRAELMGDLLEGSPDNGSTFQDLPLPEERGQLLKEQAEVRRLARRTGKYFQVYASGVSLRLDSHRECCEHNLASCMNLAAQDFFLAETISSDRPVKMIGEWLNEDDHPRESRDGLLTMKMVTWHPVARVTPDNAIANDVCEAALKMLPLRCILDQRAIRFIFAFFGGDRDTDDCSQPGLPPGLHAVPPPILRHFRVDPVKLKIDYTPQRVDTKALRDGAIVELINLTPLDGMVLTLKLVQVENVVGFGDALSIVIRRWISHICQTQLYKFLTNTRALEPLTSVGGGVADMVILPWEAIKHRKSIKKAFRAGVSSATKAFTFEALTTTSRLAHFAAGVAEATTAGTGSSGLLSRPLETPRNILDTTPHVIESLARGLQIANYKVVIIPYREYHRSGTTGAVKSVLKGIPVAIAAPASGAVEALSFALLGARNQIRPDIRREEEASQRGLHFEG